MESTRKAKPSGKPPGKKHTAWNVIKIILIVLFLMIIIGAVTVIFYVRSVLSGIEPIDPTLIQAKLYENSVIVDSEGRVLEYLQYNGLRKVVHFDEMSPSAIDAFVAVEDKTFYKHHGFNYVRLVGAVVQSITSGDRIGGTSTLTQQLARNIYLYDAMHERTLSRKVKEAYYTVQLEKYLTKNQILEGYLNYVNFGANSYGIEAAAQTYFSKSAKDLNYVESAILAGTVKAPGIYAPTINLYKKQVTEENFIYDDTDPLITVVFNDQCKNRYLTCLALMYENGKISESEYKKGKEIDLRQVIHFGRSYNKEISSYFSDLVVKDVLEGLMEKYGYTPAEAEGLLYTGGLKIESTIDFDMQKTAESNYDRDNFSPYFGDSVAKGVRAFQREYGLAVDGSAGKQTLAKIGEVTGMDTTQFTAGVYHRGSHGEEVVLLKKTLFDLGFLVNNENFPKMKIRLDEQGNIIQYQTGQTIIYKKQTLIDNQQRYIIRADEYKMDGVGNLILLKNKKLNFYSHYEDGELSRIQLVVKDVYDFDPKDIEYQDLSPGYHTVDSIFTFTGRDVLIPDEYKSFDDAGNVVVARAFLESNPSFFITGDSGNLLIEKGNYVMSDTGVIQPQSSAVLIDYRTGELKVMIGGRNIVGQRVFNRAINPRQPGSAIKPLSIFTPAIDSGKYTAASPLDDRPYHFTGNPNVRWPVNWYENYSNMYKHWGIVTLRESLRWSINTTAVYLADQLSIPTCASYLEKFGITSLIKEGSINDMNYSAMALGGMTRGISPLELTEAYGALANKGTLNKVITFKKVTNARGEVILGNETRSSFVVDEKVAYVVQDMMMTSVLNGVATNAKLYPNNDIIPVAGKTGTTSDNIDAWFVGYTPYYVGSVWFGNDINIPLDQGSAIAASFWKSMMAEIHDELEPKGFVRPEGIVTAQVDSISGKLPTDLSHQDPRGDTVISEIFLRGTIPTEEDDVHQMVRVCKSSGKLASEFCPEDEVEEKVMVVRPIPYDPKENNDIELKDSIYDAPTEICDIHDQNSWHSIKNPDLYLGIEPTKELPFGSVQFQRPYPIEMMDGTILVVPEGASILTNGDVIYPSGRIIKRETIKVIRTYTSDELDLMFMPKESTTEGENELEPSTEDVTNRTE